MEKVVVDKAYYEQLRSDSRTWPWALLIMGVICLFMGVWLGAVVTESSTYDTCLKKNEVTYQSKLFIHDLVLTCDIKSK